MTEEIVATEGDLRVKLVQDDCPMEPDFEGGFPVLRVDYDYGFSGNGVSFTGYGDDIIDGERVLSRFVSDYGASDGIDVFARWLRIFHDGNLLVRRDLDRSADYLTYSCREQVEAWGSFDGELVPEMDEWAAYVTGDVWGVVVEERVHCHHVVTAGNGDLIREEDEDLWVEVEDGATWGYYGYRWAEQAALEALGDRVAEAAWTA